MKSLRPLIFTFAVVAMAQAQDAPSTLDFGDHRSETLTSKAWAAYESKDFAAAEGYTSKCIEMFKDQAVAQQNALSAPLTVREEIFTQWALNDVGTCLFIQGQTFEKQGKTTEAIASYKFLVDNLSYAQTWDPKGWFWAPANAAAERIKALEFDAL